MPPKAKQAAAAAAASSSSSGGSKGKSARPAAADSDFSDDEDGGGDKKAGVTEDDLLPKDVVPVHYSLRLCPNYSDWTFSARLLVSLRIDAPTDQIQFNAADLDIREAFLSTPANGKMDPTRINHDEEEEVTTLRFDEILPTGHCELVIVYSGHIRSDMTGLYRSSYEHAGKRDTVLVTQFEACDARRCLPCWDEPARKATFALTLIIPSELQAVSNMPVRTSRVLHSAEELPADRADALGWTEVSFDPTPVMSSYLLAFAIGRFSSVQRSTATGTIVRILVPLGRDSVDTPSTGFALDLAVRCLEFYSAYFDIAYPLPKLDLIAIPDVANVAMENWGLITFSETSLLVHPQDGSQSGKQYAAWVIAHEIAHQWFGNICTMTWWTDLWLNEGFASWMECFCVDALFPEWQMWQTYLTDHYSDSLDTDSLASSHPVEVEIDDPSEIDEIFDDLAYSKGSVIVRMLHSYLGPEAFRAGVSAYLKKHAYSNATTQDLWASLAASSGKDVASMMSAWSLQQNYPLITVKAAKIDAASGQLAIEVTQRKFLSHALQDKDATTWSVPLSIVVAGGGDEGQSETQLLTTGEGRFEFKLSADAAASSSSSAAAGSVAARAWKLNPSQTFFYRTVYPIAHYATLRASLASFSAEDRMGLQDDLFAAFRAGLLPFALLAEFVEEGYVASRMESSYAVWSDLTANLRALGSCLKSAAPELYNKFCIWSTHLYRQVLARLGWEAQAHEDHSQSMLRGLILSALVGWNDAATCKECCRRFYAFIINEQTQMAQRGSQAAALAASSASASGATVAGTLSPDIRSAVYSAVVSCGGVLGYEAMLARYHSQASATGAGNNREEAVRCLRSLGCVADRAQLASTLDWALDEAKSDTGCVRAEDCSELIQHAASSCAPGVFEFLKRRWVDVVAVFEGGAFALPAIVGIGALFCSAEVSADYAAFMKRNKAPSAERAVKQTCERMHANTKMMAREEKNITKWIGNRVGQLKIAAATAAGANAAPAAGFPAPSAGKGKGKAK